MERNPESDRLIHRVAIAAAVATFLLLSVGGVVTSRDAGMIFTDWPLSNGSVNPDGWLSHPDKRAEHGHRLIGAAVGMLTLTLAYLLHRRESRRWVRRLGYVAVVAVILQGVLGGLRVTENSGALALLHGCSGQAFFGIMVALAYATSRDARRAPEEGRDLRGMFVVSVAVTVAIYLQVVVGAQLRHHSGPVDTHFYGGLLVAGTVFWLLTVALLRHPERAGVRRPVQLLAGMLLVQVALGFSTAGAVAQSTSRGYSLAQVAIPTAHQSVGAIMFATSLMITLRIHRRLSPAVRHPVEAAA